MRIRRGPGMTALCLLPVLFMVLAPHRPVGARADEPKGTLEDRNRHAADVRKFRAEGKLDEALASARKKLAVERELFGNEHIDVADSLDTIAGLHEARDELDAAQKPRREALDIKTKVLGPGHWQVTDARLALAHVEQLTKLTPAQRRAVAEATESHERARQLRSQAKYADALPLARKAADTRKELLGARNAHYAVALESLAQLHSELGREAQAEALYRDALAVQKPLLGEKHPDYIGTLNNLAVVYMELGQHAKAEPVIRQAAAAAREVHGEQHPVYASTLYNLGQLYSVSGRRAQAEPLLRQAMEIRGRVLGEKHPDYANSLRTLASYYRDVGAHARAEPLSRRAVEIEREAHGEKHPRYASALSGLAHLHEVRGDYAEAEKLYRQALEIRKQAFGEKHREYAGSLHDLGQLFSTAGEFAKAEPFLRQAVALRTEALGEKHPHTLRSVSALAAVHQSRGDHAAAEPLMLRAAAARKEAVGEKHPDYATSLHDLGFIYWSMGESARAIPYFQKALEIQKEALGVNHPAYANTLHNLAFQYWTVGEFAKAEPLYLQAVDVLTRTVGEKSSRLANALINLGVVYHDLGEFAKAEPLFEKGVATLRQSIGEAHSAYAGSVYYQAALYRDLGDAHRAEPLFRKALELARPSLGDTHRGLALVLDGFAAFHHGRGEPAQAEPLLREELAMWARVAEDAATGRADRLWLNTLARFRGAADGYLTVAPATRASGGELYRPVLGWKAAAVPPTAWRHLAGEQPDLKPAFDELADTRAQLARLAYTSPQPRPGQPTYPRLVAEVRKRAADLERRLAAQSEGFRREQARARLEADDVARALPEKAALVDYFFYTHFDPPAAGKGPPRRERRLAAFVLRRSRKPECVFLGPAAAVEKAVLAWREALTAGEAPALAKAAAEAGRLVWQPLRTRLAGADTVLVSPDGVLGQVPLAALPGERPGSYLIEELAVVTVVSGRHAAEGLSAEPRPAGRGLLAVGGIDPGAELDAGRRAAAIPGRPAPAGDHRDYPSEPQTALLAGEARDRFRRTVPDERAALLSGAEAHERGVKEALTPAGGGKGLRYVLLAGPGFSAPPTALSALRIEIKETPTGRYGFHARPDGRGVDHNPLRLTGVVLSGATRPGAAPAEEDGILTGEEVAALDLRGAELVVLPAHDPGPSDAAGGEGVLGLQRAFQAAGAASLVVSLWRTDDAAAALLLEELYANLWEKKLPRREALRQAQLTVLKHPERVEQRRTRLAEELAQKGHQPAPAAKLPGGGKVGGRSHPSLWAGFVLSGNGR